MKNNKILLLILLMIIFPSVIIRAAVTSITGVTLNPAAPTAGATVSVSWNYVDTGSADAIILISTSPTVQYSGTQGQWLMVTDGCTVPANPATAQATGGGCAIASSPATSPSFALPSNLIPGITYYVIVAMRDYGAYLNSTSDSLDYQAYTTFTLPLPPEAISLTKTVQGDSTDTGLEMLYTLDYYAVNTNGNFIITDPVPAGVNFIRAYEGGTFSGGTVSWNLGAITSPVNGSVYWVGQVSGTTPAGTNIVNTANASTNDTTIQSNTASITTGEKFTISKSASPNVVNVYNSITYTMTYSNTGYTFITLTAFDSSTDISNWIAGGAPLPPPQQFIVTAGILSGSANPATAAGPNYYPKLMCPSPVQHDGIYMVDAYVPNDGGTVNGGSNSDAVLIFCSSGNNSNEIHARIRMKDGSVRLDTVINNTWTNVASNLAPGFTMAYNNWYTIKAQVRGCEVKVEVFQQGTPDPGIWQIDYNANCADTTIAALPPGYAGVQVDQVEDWFDNFAVFGPGPAVNTIIYDTLPACTTYQGCTCTGMDPCICGYSASTNMVTWSYPGWMDDVSGATAQFWVTANLCAGGTTLTNTACMNSAAIDPPICSNIATVQVTPATPTNTPSFTKTPTFTPTFTSTNTSTNTSTFTPTFSPTYTQTFTPTATPTFTKSPTLSPTFTPTYTPTFTDTSTSTITPTDTPTYTPTRTPTYTYTFTATPTYTPSFTPTYTPTFTYTYTPTFTFTDTPTYTFTYTPTYTLTFTPTFTRTNTPTDTLTYTQTFTPTITVTDTNTITPTPIEPIMQLTKTVSPPSAQPGDTVTYIINFENTGLAAATGYTITDQLDESLAWLSGGTHSGGVSRDNTNFGGTVTWSIGNVPAGSTWQSVSLVAEVDPGIENSAQIQNIAHSSDSETPSWDFTSNAATLNVNVPTLKINPITNYPNPFKDKTTIVFYVSVRAQITMKFYTISGELIRTMNPSDVLANLVSGTDINPGENSVNWDGKNQSGQMASSGVYFYRLDAVTDTGEKAHFINKLAILR